MLEGSGKEEPSYIGGECQMALLFWQFINRLNINLSYNPALYSFISTQEK
jgi:hypothetical protein